MTTLAQIARGTVDAIVRDDECNDEFSEVGRGWTFCLGWIVCSAFVGTVTLALMFAYGMI